MAKLSEFIIDKLNNGVSDATDRLIDRVYNESQMFVDMLEDRVLLMQRKIVRSTIRTLTYAATGVLGLLTIFYALREYALLSNTFSFLIVGVLTFILGLIVSYRVKGSRRRDYGYTY